MRQRVSLTCDEEGEQSKANEVVRCQLGGQEAAPVEGGEAEEGIEKAGR